MQGDQFLSKLDVASARQLYQRAAEAGDGRGALRMGMTFDPVFLARWRLRGVRAERAQAIGWYRRATSLGNADAELMQTSLFRGPGSIPRSTTAGQYRQSGNAGAAHQRTNHTPRGVRESQGAKRG